MNIELAHTPIYAVEPGVTGENLDPVAALAGEAAPRWHRPLPARLRTALHLGVLLAFCLIGIAILWIRATSVSSQGQDAVRVEARALATGLAMALAHQDRPALMSHLEGLALRPDLAAVNVLDADGRSLAAMGRSSGSPEFESDPPANAFSAALAQRFPSAIRVREPVRNASEVLGTVVLDADLSARWGALYVELTWIVAVLMAALLLCAGIVNSVQQRICDPLHSLARNCKVIIEDRDYTLRAWKTARDDFGTIVDCVNHLLDEIQQRGRALIDARGAVARALAERTPDAVAVPAPPPNHYRGQFLANMCHEIRTPLNRLQQLSTQMNTADLSKEHRERLAAIRESSDSVIALVDDMLDFTRIRGGTLELGTATFAPAELLTASLQPYLDRAAAKGLTLTPQPDPALPARLQGDGPRLRRVIGYLLAHALKYAPGGTIQVHMGSGMASDGRTQLHVRVLDSGIGIAEEARQRVHRALTQESPDSDAAMPNGAAGLGLYIAHHLVRRMDGELTLCELDSGSGFEFFVVMNAVAVPTAPQDPVETQAAVEPAKPILATTAHITHFAESKTRARPEPLHEGSPPAAEELDQDLSQQVIEIYLDSAPDLLEQLIQGIRQRTSEQILAAAHTLGACSARVGANELADLCKKVESRAHQPSQLTRYIKSLSTAHDRAREALRNDMAHGLARPRKARSPMSSTLS